MGSSCRFHILHICYTHSLVCMYQLLLNFYQNQWTKEEKQRKRVWIQTSACFPTSPIPSWRVGSLKLSIENTFICRVYFRAPGKTEPGSPGFWWSLSVQAPASGLCSVGGIIQLIAYWMKQRIVYELLLQNILLTENGPCMVPSTTCWWLFSKWLWQ